MRKGWHAIFYVNEKREQRALKDSKVNSEQDTEMQNSIKNGDFNIHLSPHLLSLLFTSYSFQFPFKKENSLLFTNYSFQFPFKKWVR